MAIKLFITGGTIDCEKIETENKYIFTKTHLPQMLEQGRNKININSEVLMLKDSIYMTDKDRDKILEKCKSCNEITPHTFSVDTEFKCTGFTLGKTGNL